jgi:hypothetical protein
MATKTGGQVDMVDPATLHKNLKSIFADDTIATNVSIVAYLPPGIIISRDVTEADGWIEVRFLLLFLLFLLPPSLVSRLLVPSSFYAIPSDFLQSGVLDENLIGDGKDKSEVKVCLTINIKIY